jgi:hypothetical protein
MHLRRNLIVCAAALAGCSPAPGAEEGSSGVTALTVSAGETAQAPTTGATGEADDGTTAPSDGPTSNGPTSNGPTSNGPTTDGPGACEGQGCSGHGTCVETQEGAVCECDDGFAGAACETAVPPESTPVQPILAGDGFYPRAIALADGRLLASIVAPQASGRLGGTILESVDGGVTFAPVGNIDGDHSLGGLCCATLYQLPAALGGLPAGALLWSASVGGDNPNAPMAIPVFASVDDGRSWSFLANVTIAGVPRSEGGLWEPEFSQLDDGSVVCHYSDETDPGHSQKLIARRSVDGVGWGEVKDIVAMSPFAARPGMPVVRRRQDGQFVMSFEICGTDGCATHMRFSSDGWAWGDVNDGGLRPATLDGKHFRHAPTLAFDPSPGGNGRLYLVGQLLFDAMGGVTGGNGAVIMANSEGGTGAWYEIAAPVPVPDAFDNFCPNYSSTLAPLEDGRVTLEVASKWENDRCRSFHARGPLHGTDDASGLTDGTGYVGRALNSGFCIDVVDGSAAPGANIRQWDCNDSDAQRFWTESLGDGTAKLLNVGSGLCVTAAGGASTPGANVEQQPCEAANTWRVENVGLGYYRVRHADGEVCLDVAGGSGEMGANIQVWSCNDLAPQIWKLDP